MSRGKRKKIKTNEEKFTIIWFRLNVLRWKGYTADTLIIFIDSCRLQSRNCLLPIQSSCSVDWHQLTVSFGCFVASFWIYRLLLISRPYSHLSSICMKIENEMDEEILVFLHFFCVCVTKQAVKAKHFDGEQKWWK